MAHAPCAAMMRGYTPRARWWTIAVAVVMSGSVAGCGGEVTAPSDASPRTACDGALGQEPRVLADGLGDGYLLVDGEDLIHVEIYQTARVRRIDGCDGTVDELGTFEKTVGAVVWGDHIYAHQTSETGKQIWRLPLSGGSAEHVTSTNSLRAMVSHPDGLYVFATAEDDPERLEVSRLDGETLLPELAIDKGNIDKNHKVVGISEAGIYFTESYDCGCTPTLKRWPFSGQELLSVEGTPGARGVSVVGGDIIVGRDAQPGGFGSGIYEIARVPLAGGEGEVVVETRDELMPIGGLRASDQLACWRQFDGPPRCVRLGLDQDAEIVELGDRTEESLVVVGEVAYWTRQMADTASFELVAAVP